MLLERRAALPTLRPRDGAQQAPSPGSWEQVPAGSHHRGFFCAKGGKISEITPGTLAPPEPAQDTSKLLSMSTRAADPLPRGKEADAAS